MERRNFLLGLLGLAAGSATMAIAGKATAAPVTGSAGALVGATAEADRAMTLPDGTAVEHAQYRDRPFRGRMPRGRRRREICRVTRNRFGRPVRVCRTVWN